MSNQVDQQIKLCQQGDVRAQEWLYKRYSSTLLGVSRRYIKDVSLAEDIVHECFIVFFNKIQDLKNTTAIEGWMRRIVVNHSLKYLKGNALHYDIDDVKELDFH